MTGDMTGRPGPYDGGDRRRHEDRDIVDSRTADALRRALNAEAASVGIEGNGLARIRERTARASRRPAWLVPVAAGVAGIVVAGGVAWAALDDSTDVPIASETSSATPTPTPSTAPLPPPTPDPTATPSSPEPTPSDEEPESPGRQVALPVYYVGAQPAGEADTSIPRFVLFREFHRTSVASDTDAARMVQLAVTEMFANQPIDPDYGGLWPAAAEIRSATVDDTTGLITVDVADVAISDVRGVEDRVLPQATEAAVHQLVYTATAAAAYADPTLPALTVRILVDGEPTTSFLGTDTTDPLRRDVMARASIWILSVEDGDTVTAPVVVAGEANTFEGGPAQWELSRDGAVVANGLTSTGACCTWRPFEIDLDVAAPGTYTIEVYDVGGLGLRDRAPYDSKTFTIE